MRLVTFLLSTTLPIAAQQADEISPPRDHEPAPIGPVIPVPLPTDTDMLAADNIAPAQPESVKLAMDGGADYTAATQTLVSKGAIRATADTGMTLSANRGRYEGESKLVIVEGQVKLRTETGVEIFADKGVLDDTARTVTLTGKVSIYQGQTLQRGDRVVYLMDEKKVDASGLRTGVDPLLLEAGQFTMEERDGEKVYVGHGAGVTTHDVEKPAFWVRSEETTVYPEDKVTFKDMKVYAGETPIFWLPYFSQPLDGDLGYHFVPGARSNWGAYLLNSYGMLLGEGDSVTGDDAWLLSRWNFDLRARRGVAGGLDLIDRRQEENPNLTGLSLYFAYDSDPTISRTGLPRPKLDHERWQAALQYRVPLSLEGGDKWRADFNINALSDNYYLEDFDSEMFRTDPSPDNTFGLFRQDENSLFGIVARVRPNDFYRSDTRLPEISFDQSRRPIFGSPILHEGITSFTVSSEEIGSATASTIRSLLALPPGSPLVPTLISQLPPYERQLVQTIRALPPGSTVLPALTQQLLNPAYTRFNTYQELSLPRTFGGWLHFTPEVGVGYSRYWNVEGPANSASRTHLYAGAEASLKFSKDFGDYRSRRWGLDGLHHVFQPYAQFSFLNTDDLEPLFPGIDRETFTTRPRTLDPSRFTAVDSLRDWSIFRFGMRNHLITRRDKQSFEWLYMDTYIDAFADDPEFDRSFSNLYNDITWMPLPWLNVDLETQFPVINDGSGYSEVAARFRFMPNENVELSIGNRFLNNHPVYTDSNRFDVSTFIRLNDKWGVGALQYWEMDDGVLELQQYTVHRDFNHWVAALGFTARDNRIDNEYGVVFSFTLKDFPSATLPLKMDAE
ncbi:LPS-assembly protein LptD [Haloferula chungangensis]|uniref:LPS-assembly protein LptD n=1 Tax=Haloferula chungangensis TaxID=1048331 RepID=A0ABW2LAA3_9BACT